MIAATDHRPWPLPRTPWVMRMTWHDLLFMHWPVSLESLRRIVPPEMTIDTYEGRAWIGVVPFRMTGVLPRYVPALPLVSAFAELNVRTYVVVGDKPGVYFFSLDAASAFAVATARRGFHLPYFKAEMELRSTSGWLHYRSRRTHRRAPSADFTGSYRPIGERYASKRGDLDHWLTERYCLYAIDRRNRVCRGEIHHSPWLLQPAEVRIEENSMTAPLNIALPSALPLLHYSERLDVVAWPLTRV